MFAIIKAAASHSTRILKSEKAVLLLSYKGMHSVCISIGSVPPDIKLKRLVVAVIAAKEENPESMSVERTSKLNWWGTVWKCIFQRQPSISSCLYFLLYIFHPTFCMSLIVPSMLCP